MQDVKVYLPMLNYPKLIRMNETIRVKKHEKLRFWLEENAKTLLAAGLISFGLLSLIAIAPGIGYSATASVTSVDLLVEGHPCLGYFVTGNLTCAFNPFLYPVTHILGYEANLTFAGLSEPHDPRGSSVKETKEVRVAFEEFPRNVPYYLTISVAVAFGSSKLIERRRRTKKPA